MEVISDQWKERRGLTGGWQGVSSENGEFWLGKME
jgi:hypothetical protein